MPLFCILIVSGNEGLFYICAILLKKASVYIFAYYIHSEYSTPYRAEPVCMLESEALMPKTDVLTRNYVNDPARFAELFNVFVFNGKDVVQSSNLEELDSSVSLYESHSKTSLSRDRDSLKVTKFMTDGNLNYLLLGIENQSSIHYAMPVRCMMYDALEYVKQIHQTTNRLKAGLWKADSDEFLSGFSRNGKLNPVMTLVINWSKKKWDGPLCLFDMFDEKMIEIYGRFIENYRINLLDFHTVPEEVLDTLQTDLKQVLYFLKYSENPEKMKLLLQKEEHSFNSMSKDAAELLRELTDTKFKIPQSANGGKVQMCKAIQQMIDDAKKEAVEKAARETAERIEKDNKELMIRNALKLISVVNPKQSEDNSAELIADVYHIDIKTVREVLTRDLTNPLK